MSDKSSILVASSPSVISVSGNSYVVQAGDRLTLSRREADEILNGPYGSRFVHIVMDIDTHTAPLLKQVQSGQSDAKLKSPGLDEQLMKPPVALSDSTTLVPSVPAANSALKYAAENQEDADALMGGITNALSNKVALEEPQSKADDTIAEEPKDEQLKTDTEPAPTLTKKQDSQPAKRSSSLPKSKGFTPYSPKAATPTAPKEDAGDETGSTDAELELPLAEDAHFSTVKKYVLDAEEANDPNLKSIAQAVKLKFPTYSSVVDECNRILA